MLARDVAALAEHRHADDQHAIVRRAVRVVTRGAVLAHGRVLDSIGPRISVWQLVHSSATELPVLRFLTLLIEPCGLWQELHDILPSRTGMCATARSVLVTWSR